ncbi:hypothetical protein [Streptomyces sp. NPDC059850]|uniref:hypothetical protein n=1 Tax=Streptomyces sp. NPDC059850 TaxID=3346970 RepID=UPI003664E159
MITATKRADWMALQIFIAARANHDVITHDLVDAVMTRDADKEQGKANKEMVRRIIRKRAASEHVRVIFTEDERYWAIREQLHGMTDAEVRALCESIADGGDDDPRGWDKTLINAIWVRLSNRPTPARLYGCSPVSIRLWREPRHEMPTPDDVNDAPQRQHVRIVNGGTVELRPATGDDLPAADAASTPAVAAPLFAALAAHEAAQDVLFTPAPNRIDNLAQSLRALGPAAPGEHHLEIVETLEDIEDAWEALRTASSATTRTTAFGMVRSAATRAKAAILAIAPHADHLRGTDMPATAEEIREAALAYNAADGTPEELSAIATGMVSVRVHCRSHSGTGWNVTARITAGVDSPAGHIPAHPPIVLKFRKRDGRHDAAENTRRMFGRRFRISVPIDYVLDRRT